MTTITITGNLARDAELRFTPNGQPVLSMRVGVTPRKKVGGTWQDDGETTWYAASIWGSMAETLAEAGVLTKGTKVTITGTLRPRTYQSASGGGLSLDVRVDAIGWHEKTGRVESAPEQDPWAAQEPPAGVPGW